MPGQGASGRAGTRPAVPGRLRLLVAGAIALFAVGCPRPEAAPGLVWFSDPLTADERVQLGAVYERDGQDERALREYAAALRRDPANLVAITGLGNISARQGKPKLAAQYYRQALALSPDNPVVLNNLALALLDLGKHQEALDAADRAVTLAGDSGRPDPRLLDTRARAREAAGDREGALADLAAAAGLCADTIEDANMARSCEEVREYYYRMMDHRIDMK